MTDQPTSADVRELLSRAFAAFNARDIDAVLSVMHPYVECFEGVTFVHGRCTKLKVPTRRKELSGK